MDIAEHSLGGKRRRSGALLFLLCFFSVVATAASAQTGACTGTTTVALTEGPFYKSGSPERSSLVETGMKGTRIVITGVVYDSQCVPIANAWLDFWQADASGAYDNQGFRLRGHQLTDVAGRFRLETVIPGEYPGRTEHIHVKLRAPNGPILTTQIFFPGVAGNSRDGIFDPSLVVTESTSGTGRTASIDFVIPRTGK
jgi:protocatechuate 3,4-dioxygenase beta subunit